MMQALDTLVKTRQVLYLGISDTPGESDERINAYNSLDRFQS